MDLISMLNIGSISVHLLNIGVSFIFLCVLLVLGHIQLKDICKQRLASYGQAEPDVHNVRKKALILAQFASFISCFYIIINCYAILKTNCTSIVDFTILYKTSTDTMILMIEYLTVIRLHKFIVDRTKKAKTSIAYDISIAFIYGLFGVYIVYSITNSYIY